MFGSILLVLLAFLVFLFSLYVFCTAHFFASDIEEAWQRWWRWKTPLRLWCTTMTSAPSACPHLPRALDYFIFLCGFIECEDGQTYSVTKPWCLRASEWCVCSAGPRWCKCTSRSVPRCLACEAGEMRWTGEAVLGPVQHDPPTHWLCACFLCHILEWPEARWRTWRSK